jgi:hypothetical protein
MLPTFNQNQNQNHTSFTIPSEMTLNNRFLQLLNNTNSLANTRTNRANILTFEPIYMNRVNRTNHGTNVTSINQPVLTALQIWRATTLFTYNPQENTLLTTTCPITLEEFIEGETLIQIQGCGHVFKTEALYRWFERNHRCPSCRHDITVPV